MGAAGLLLHAIVGFPLQMPALAGWFAVLLGFACGLLGRPGKLRRGIPGWAGALGALAFLGLGLFSISEPARAWNAESLYARGQHALIADQLEDAEDLFAQALRANPRAALIWLKLAEVKAVKEP